LGGKKGGLPREGKREACNLPISSQTETRRELLRVYPNLRSLIKKDFGMITKRRGDLGGGGGRWGGVGFKSNKETTNKKGGFFARGGDEGTLRQRKAAREEKYKTRKKRTADFQEGGGERKRGGLKGKSTRV